MSEGVTIMSPQTLPTPAPSTEILGKPFDGGFGRFQIDTSFSLPPAAIAGNATDSNATTSPSSSNSDSSYRPLSPPSVPVPAATGRSGKQSVARRRSSGSANQPKDVSKQNGYTIPPPPTRKRKIIQMKPHEQEAHDQDMETSSLNAKNQHAPALAEGTGKTTPTGPAGAKRRQGGGQSTAAGRKTARKTAHSLIERRRRSKMNEEFGVLKDMIPACAGQEMHKLAILQASIEYMRYLEQCLTDLKAAHSQCPTTGTASLSSSPPLASMACPIVGSKGTLSAEDSDELMSDAPPSPRLRPNHPQASSVHSNQVSISPVLLPGTSHSPTKSRNHSIYDSGNSSSLPSPAYEPQAAAAGSSYSMFTTTSPTREPRDSIAALDKEMEKDDRAATAALLMLNADRRMWSGTSRGISVKDLLSA